jgi:hypothetical protein
LPRRRVKVYNPSYPGAPRRVQIDLVNALQQQTRRVTVVGDDSQSIYAVRE